MYPLILVKSFGLEKSANIIQEILRVNGDSYEDMIISFDDHFVKAYKLNICTKYYKTQIFLFECEDITNTPNAVKNCIEGSILYFDSDDKSFLGEVQTLKEFIKDSNIEISALITRDLNEKNGLSYEDIMSKCKFDINIIDLSESFDTSEDGGYIEVLEFLKNHVWSSIVISGDNTMLKDEDDHINDEEALNEFEVLLNKFQQFKDVSKTLCREDVLKNAENLAELFSKMLNED